MAVARHRYTPRALPASDVKQISYTGMRDSRDPSTADPRKASLLHNVYPVLSRVGGGVEGRPGYKLMGSQLGGGGRTQLLFQFSQIDGTEQTVAIVGGKFYTYNWGAGTWNETLTAAHLSAASVTLSSTAKVSAVIFADKLIISDGVNTPWAWDGTAGGGITLLSNAPVAYGPPTVYYSRLFFIKNTERTTMVWSEINQPNTGYEAGGYNLAWTLGQTDQEALTRLFGTNDALYYWRARSMGSITGEAEDQFQTTGTHDSISQDIGTSSPWSVVFHNDAFSFVDSEGHTQRFVLGAGFQFPPVWHDSRETMSRLSPEKLDQIRGMYRPKEDVIHFPFTPVSADENALGTVYAADTGEFSGVWEYNSNLVELAVVKDGSGGPVVVHGTEDGYIHMHGAHDGTLWSDNGVKITHKVWGSPILWDPREEKIFSRLDASFRLESNLSGMSFSMVTPDCDTAALSPDALTGGLSLWGAALWGISLWSVGSVEVHIAIGFECRGRWLQPRLIHDTLNERFALLGWSVLAHFVGRDPFIT